MSKLFSPSTKGFYLRSVHGESIPSDAVELSDDEYSELIAAPESGKRVDVDASGNLVAVNAVPEAASIVSVSPIQALTALDNAGFLATLDAHMQDPATPLLVRRAYMMATEWRRDSLLVTSAATALGLTEQEIDALFLAASQIKV